MIPSVEILGELDMIPLLNGDDSDFGPENYTHYYQFVVGMIQIWKDPFFLLKQKCLPEAPPTDIQVTQSITKHVAIPFPITKINSPSFEKKTMPNLLVDVDGTLLQLLYVTESDSPPREGSRIITVIEYCDQFNRLLARKIQTP